MLLLKRCFSVINIKKELLKTMGKKRKISMLSASAAVKNKSNQKQKQKQKQNQNQKQNQKQKQNQDEKHNRPTTKVKGFDPIIPDNPLCAHTLILGTYPSIPSFQAGERGEPFGNRSNSFWWICGDALGFRRLPSRLSATGSTDAPSGK